MTRSLAYTARLGGHVHDQRPTRTEGDRAAIAEQLDDLEPDLEALVNQARQVTASMRVAVRSTTDPARRDELIAEHARYYGWDWGLSRQLLEATGS